MGLGDDDRALQGGHGEVGDLVAFNPGPHGAAVHGRAQAIAERLLHVLENLDYALAQLLAAIAALGAEIAVQAAIAHAVAVQVRAVQGQIVAQALQRRQRVVAQREVDGGAAVGEINFQDLHAEVFLRREIAGERFQRQTGRLGDVGDAGLAVAARVDDAQAFRQQQLAVRGGREHGDNEQEWAGLRRGDSELAFGAVYQKIWSSVFFLFINKYA